MSVFTAFFFFFFFFFVFIKKNKLKVVDKK